MQGIIKNHCKDGGFLCGVNGVQPSTGDGDAGGVGEVEARAEKCC